MEKFLITGERSLSGEITASGSKNAALPLLFLSLMADDKCELRRVPALTDIQIALQLLEVFGVSNKAKSTSSFYLDPSYYIYLCSLSVLFSFFLSFCLIYALRRNIDFQLV